MRHPIEVLCIKPDEAGLVFSLGVVLFGNAVATQISGIAAVSGLLSGGSGGSQAILVVWVIDSLLVLALAGLQAPLVDRLDRRTLMRAMTLSFACIFIGLRFLFDHAPGWLNYGLLYVVSDVQWLFYPLVFWVLASDIFDPSQSRRIFPIIAALGSVGKLVGIGIGAVSAQWLAGINFSSHLLVFNFIIYLALSLGLLAWKKGPIKPHPVALPKETFRQSLVEGWSFVRRTPALRYLAIVAVSSVMIQTFIEFRFLVISGALADYETFYSLYRLGWVVVAIGIQTFVANRLIEKMGLGNTFVILPLVAMLCSVWMLLLPGIASAVGGTVLLRWQQYTVDESARKSFQTLVPAERRGRVSLFLDSVLYSVGGILGCAITGLATWLSSLAGQASGDFYIYLGASVLMSLVAFGAVIKMQKFFRLPSAGLSAESETGKRAEAFGRLTPSSAPSLVLRLRHRLGIAGRMWGKAATARRSIFTAAMWLASPAYSQTTREK